MFDKLFGKKKPSITVLPHARICPSGDIVKGRPGMSIAETLVAADVDIGHSCQYQCSCTTCHVHVMEGQAHLSPMHEEERLVLSRATGLTQWSRLACQCVFQGGGDVVIEIVE